MNRTVTLVAITLVSALATPVVVNATTPKKADAAAATVIAPTALACTRPVRVVYAGYGEGQATACAASVQ